MIIKNEVGRIVKQLVNVGELDPNHFDAIVNRVMQEITDGNCDFSNLSYFTIHKNNKKRHIAHYNDITSTQYILCQYIKSITDKVMNLHFVNRNSTIRHLFDILTAVKDMTDFTIVKFDFKDYFNTVSAPYVFEKLIKSRLSRRCDIDLITKFAYETKCTYAGLCTSNSFAELLAREFDSQVKSQLNSEGLIYYSRYVDDGLLILNKHMNRIEILKLLQQALKRVYYDDLIQVEFRCKTNFNMGKYRCINRRNIQTGNHSFDYLGYEFSLSINNRSKCGIEYGITQEKMDKYSGRIGQIISSYIKENAESTEHDPLELLRHRIAAFTSRTVYVNKRYHSNIWKVKGFIANYRELRFIPEYGRNSIQNDTRDFLQGMVGKAFDSANVKRPNFLQRNYDCYSLFENLKTNRTLLLVEHIGYDYMSLSYKCEQIGIKLVDKNKKQKSYATLVREYLIKVRVGY